MPSVIFPLKIGGIPMVRFPYKIHIGSRDTAFGYVYRAAFASLKPKTSFDWDDPGPDPVLSPFKDSVQTPEDLQVLSPAGGSILSRSKQVDMRWTGSGNIVIVISTYNTVTGKTRPVLQLQPAVNTGKAVIEPRLLALLPQTKDFVF